MSYIPITPFGRPVDASVIEMQQIETRDRPPEGVNKYELLRELTAAKKALQVTDRELTVLQALLSFHPQTVLGGNSENLLVYPSNASLCERLNGMPCSTMRRHLAGLVSSGLIMRRDSPNGKRYVKRYGNEAQAFGFDLMPLVIRFREICDLAEDARAKEEEYQRLRRSVSLMRRDLAGLAAYGSEIRPELAIWDAFSDLARLSARELRRKLSSDDLINLESTLLAALNEVRDLFDIQVSENLDSNAALNEHHLQNSNKDLNESEKNKENKREKPARANEGPKIPLELVLRACQEVGSYFPGRIRHWHELVRAADRVRPMMGISTSAWHEAQEHMGCEQAAVTVLAILQRLSDIKSPGGYLRALTRKAADGKFSCGPMVLALLNTESA